MLAVTSVSAVSLNEDIHEQRLQNCSESRKTSIISYTENYFNFIKTISTDYCVGYILFLFAMGQEMRLWVCINVNKLKK